MQKNECRRTQKLFFSAKDLIDNVSKANNIEPRILQRGLKKKFSENPEEESLIIKSYQGKPSSVEMKWKEMKVSWNCRCSCFSNTFSDDLFRLISSERIARAIDRSQADLCDDGKIIVTRRTGKWYSFGTANCLDPHEALYLIEMVCVNVWFVSP